MTNSNIEETLFASVDFIVGFLDKIKETDSYRDDGVGEHHMLLSLAYQKYRGEQETFLSNLNLLFEKVKLFKGDEGISKEQIKKEKSEDVEYLALEEIGNRLYKDRKIIRDFIQQYQDSGDDYLKADKAMTQIESIFAPTHKCTFGCELPEKTEKP